MSVRKFHQNFFLQGIYTFLSVLNSFVVTAILIRRLGVSGYGELALYSYWATFFRIFFDFSFPIYGVVEGARRHRNANAIRSLLKCALLLKIPIIVLFSALVAILWYLELEAMRDVRLSLLVAVSANQLFLSFQPVWFFTALERMEFVIAPIAVTLLINVSGVLIYVNEPSDIIFAPWIGAMSALVGAIWMLMTAHRMSGGNEKWKEFRDDLQDVTRAALQLIASRILVSGYGLVTPMLVFSAGGHVGVTIYNIAERLLLALRQPFDIGNNALMPISAKDFSQSRVRFYVVAAASCAFVLWLVTSALAPWIVFILSGSSIEGADKAIRVYTLALPAIAIHGVLGSSCLLVHGYRNLFTLSIAIGLVSYLLSLSVIFLLGLSSVVSIIVAMVIVELFILLARAAFSRYYGCI